MKAPSARDVTIARRLRFGLTNISSPHRMRSLALRLIAKNVRQGALTGRTVTIVAEGGIGDFVLKLPEIVQIQQRYQVGYLAVERNVTGFARCLVSTVEVMDTTNLAASTKVFETSDVIALSVRLSTARFFASHSYSIVAWPLGGRKHRQQPGREVLEGLPSNWGNEEPDHFGVFSQGRDLTRPHLVLKAGSSDLRRWPTIYWVDLIHKLSGTFDIFLVGSAEEWDQSENIRVASGELSSRNVCGKTSPAGLLALLKRSVGVVATDSGIAHLAGVLNRPVVVLFGPSDPAVWQPFGAQTRVLYHPRWCSPCQQIYCPYEGQGRCMGDITPSEVIAALETVGIFVQKEFGLS